MTRETTTRFTAPVRVGARHEVRAKVVDSGDDLVCEGVVYDADGNACATARAVFEPLGAAQATDAIGTEVTGTDAAYVRRSPDEQA